MMSSRLEPRKKTGDGSGNGKLLHDIEAISKSLYPEKTRSKNSLPNLSSRSKSVAKSHLEESRLKLKDSNEESHKDKKSIWWKGFKAFTRNRRFNCCFSLEVHSIEGLPSCFDDLNLCVHWKRRDGGLVTRPARVFQGMAEFGDHLTLTCSIYGSRNGPHHSAKYEAKHFLLYAAVDDAPDLDLGKHRVDLTRFLPLTLEELEDEKSSAKWTTSFKLSGIAKGASMNVSFGYSVVGSNSSAPLAKSDVSEVSGLKRNNSTMVKPLIQNEQSGTKGMIQHPGSLPARSSSSSRSVEDIKDLHEVLPTASSELAKSVSILYRKLDEEKLDPGVDYKSKLDICSDVLEAKPNSDSVSSAGIENVKNEHEDCKFSIVELEMEASKEQMKSEEGSLNADYVPEIESSVLPDIESSVLPGIESSILPKIDSAIGLALEEDNKLQPQVEECGSYSDELVISDCTKENDMGTKESLMKDLELALHNVTDMGTGVDSPEGDSEKSDEENFVNIISDYKKNRRAKSLNLDDVTNSVADEFLNMLGIEHSPFGLSSESEPESPRERLLRQFEKDALASGCSLFNFDIEDGNQEEFGYKAPTESGWDSLGEVFNLFSFGEGAEQKLEVITETETTKPRASMLEDLETETLMREWGLNEKAFVESPPGSSVGFESPIDISSEEHPQLPPLGESVGPFVQTKNGGFLRSMNPTHFRNAKSGGSLIMQVSSPVVVPAEMGSGIIEILERLASMGIEKLSMQANKLMPLEDITGKTMQQVAWEAVPGLEAPERQVPLEHESEIEHNVSPGQKREMSSGFRSSKLDSSSAGKEINSEYVSLDDLAPLAMDKIEALSIEGLRIQSGMSDEDAPSNISPQTFGEISALEGKRVNIGGSLGLEGAGGLQLLDIKESNDNDLDCLMGLSLTLDEWLRLDSGEIDDEDEISERTSKILAAHHATDLIRERSKAERKRKGSGRKGGLLGNNFTVALLVQLRDPLRNYEPVGTPMLALIQVERVFVPPKPKIYSTVSEVRNNTIEDEEVEPAKKEEIKVEPKDEEGVAQFRITEVHVAGLKTEPAKKKIWGSATQQQSGSRWLLANGMGKGKKPPLIKSKAVAKSAPPATVTTQPGDTLWSISARVHGTGAKWKELAKLNPHIRNPNIILPNETIRLR